MSIDYREFIKNNQINLTALSPAHINLLIPRFSVPERGFAYLGFKDAAEVADAREAAALADLEYRKLARREQIFAEHYPRFQYILHNGNADRALEGAREVVLAHIGCRGNRVEGYILEDIVVYVAYRESHRVGRAHLLIGGVFIA